MGGQMGGHFERPNITSGGDIFVGGLLILLIAHITLILLTLLHFDGFVIAYVQICTLRYEQIHIHVYIHVCVVYYLSLHNNTIFSYQCI